MYYIKSIKYYISSPRREKRNSLGGFVQFCISSASLCDTENHSTCLNAGRGLLNWIAWGKMQGIV